MNAEFCVVLERAHAERLAHAERVLRWFVETHVGILNGLDVAYDGPRRVLMAFVRLERDRVRPPDLQRMRFWVTRAGGSVRTLSELSPGELAELQKVAARCDVRAIGVDASGAARAITAIATAAGLDGTRRCYADDRPTLTLDIGGPGWEGVRWSDDEESLFIASPIAPPLGDPIPVLFRTRGVRRAALEWARVVAVRSVEEARPGHPAGFALGLSTAPPELRREISRSARTAEYGTRAAPRYSFARPLSAYFRDDRAAGGERPPMVAGWIENLSLGGAFVRTASPAAEGTRVELSFTLPTGSRVVVCAAVVFADVRGMGVRFVLERTAVAQIHEALTQLSGRPRRALVIDDDGLVRQQLADALVERGFEVLTACDAKDGLRALAEEVLSLDLLVTDHFLPGTLGEELVAAIRRIGGESDLLIAVVTGSPDSDLARRLSVAGADVLLGKELGAEIIAMKVDSLLEARITGEPLSAMKVREWRHAANAPARCAGGEVLP